MPFRVLNQLFRPIIAMIALMGVLFVSGACGTGSSADQKANSAGKITAVASTNIWGSVLSAVGGDKVAVTSIVDDPSADPHSFESTPADAIAVRDAQLVLFNGGGYDGFFAKLAEQSPNPRKLVAFDIAGKTGQEVNEHIWYDLASVRKVVDQVASQLSELQPANKEVFTANAAAFNTGITDLLVKVQQLGVQYSDARVLATEPVADYLLDAAGLDNATPAAFSNAVEQETDVPVAAVNEVTQLITGKQVKAVIDNVQTTTPVTEQAVEAAKKAGLPVVSVTETLPAGTTSYLSWMSAQVEALSGALRQ